MENAAEALKMAAFVILFAGALTIAMLTFNNTRATAQSILYNRDNRNRYTYIDEQDYIISGNEFKTERIVSLDTILPTLYRYYKENYRVEFYKENGSPLYLYTNRDGERTNALDIDDEMQTYEYWQGSPQATKEHLDKIVTEILLSSYKNAKFKEELGIKDTLEQDNELMEDINKQTKRVIKYTVVS